MARRSGEKIGKQLTRLSSGQINARVSHTRYGRRIEIERDFPGQGLKAERAARKWQQDTKEKLELAPANLHIRRGGRWVVIFPPSEGFTGYERDFGENFDEALLWLKVNETIYRNHGWLEQELLDSGEIVQTSFSELADSFLDAKDGIVADNTWLLYKQQITNHLLPQWGQVNVRTISKRAIQEWLNVLKRREDVSFAQLDKIVKLFRQIMAFAEDPLGILETNPVSKKLSYPRPKKRARTPLTIDQVKSLVNSTPGRYRLMVQLLAVTGMRVGELFPLQVDDFSLDQRTVSISRHVSRDKAGKYVVSGGTKTGDDKLQLIYLGAEISELLGDYLEGKQGSELAFPAPEGGIWDHNNWISRVWNPAIRSANIDAEKYATGPHLLRTTMVSLNMNLGGRVTGAQRQAGHANVSTTQNIYQKPYDEDAQKTASILSEAIL